jgi:hypothetical protein
MTLPVLLAALPEITPGGKLILGFWTVWVVVMFVGFLAMAFRTDNLEIVQETQHTDAPKSH